MMQTYRNTHNPSDADGSRGSSLSLMWTQAEAISPPVPSEGPPFTGSRWFTLAQADLGPISTWSSIQTIHSRFSLQSNTSREDPPPLNS